MTSLFLKIYDFLAERRWLTVTLAVVLTVVFAFLASRVRYEEDIAKFLPNSGESRKYQEVYQQFAAQSRIVVVFSPVGDSLEIEAAQEAMQQYGDILCESGMAENVCVTVDETQIFDLMDAVYAHLPYLLEEADYRRMDSLLQTPGFVRERLEADKQMLMFPTSGVFMRTLPSDPLQLFTPALRRLNSLKLNDAFQVVDGYLFTTDGQHGIITFDSPFGSNESYNNGRLAEFLEEKAVEVHQQFPDVEIVAVGGPLIAAANASQIKRDSVTAVVIAVVLILLILFLHYRRLSDILWVGASILFGALFSLAGIAVIRGGISLIVVGLGSVIIGIVANYPLHFLDEYKEVGDRREALREMVMPLFIGNLTTVAAFFCMLWLDARAMQDLGLFASLMLLGTILFVLVFLPQFMRKRPAPSEHLLFGRWTSLHLSRGKARPWILGIGLIITVILGYYSQRTSFDSDLSHINYMTPTQRENLEILSQVQSSGMMYAVAEGADLQETVDRHDALIAKLTESECVTSISGVGEMLPSQQRRRVAADRWNAFWDEEKRRDLVQEVRREAVAQGFSDDAFRPFSEMFSDSVQVSDIEDFDDVVEMFTGKYVYPLENGYRIVSYVQTGQPDAVHALVDHDDASAFVFTGSDVASQLVDVLRDSFNYIGIVCSVVVFVFLLLSFRRIELALLAFLPLAVGWIWILGIMHLTGVQFNIVNIILATFIFGQGDDYTIFITEGLLYEYSTGKSRLASYKHSVVISALIMFAGIGCLIVAKHPALRSLALVTIVGMATVVMMASFLPPVIFDWLTKKNGQLRKTPLTLKLLLRTFLFGLCFLLFFLLFMIPYTALFFFFGKNTEEKRLRYHKILQRMSDIIIRHLCGVRFSVGNPMGETFDKPAVIIANHQSFLDLLCMMSLTPKIIFLTKDRVWNNPFFGLIIRKAEFLPATGSMDSNFSLLRDLYARGYSVCIFPEGTRSPNHDILRFHKGAFILARELNADILPVFLHGTGFVFAKDELVFREGAIYVEVSGRVRPFDQTTSEADELQDRAVTNRMRSFFKTHYAEICQQQETPDYWRVIRKNQAYYKI